MTGEVDKFENGLWCGGSRDSMRTSDVGVSLRVLLIAVLADLPSQTS